MTQQDRSQAGALHGLLQGGRDLCSCPHLHIVIFLSMLTGGKPASAAVSSFSLSIRVITHMGTCRSGRGARFTMAAASGYGGG